MSKNQSKQHELLVYLPKNCRVMNPDGSTKGYFADVQYVQHEPFAPNDGPIFGYHRDGNIKSNPHVYSKKVKGVDGSSFTNHQVFYPADFIHKLTKISTDGLDKPDIYQVKSRDRVAGYTHNRVLSRSDLIDYQKKMPPEEFDDIYQGSVLCVKAELMQNASADKNQLVINPNGKIDYDQEDYGGYGYAVNQRDLTELAKAKTGTALSPDRAARFLGHALNSNKIRIVPNKSTGMFDVRINDSYSGAKWQDFHEPNLSAKDVIKTLTDAYHDGAVQTFNNNRADTVFGIADASIGRKFNVEPNSNTRKQTWDALYNMDGAFTEVFSGNAEDFGVHPRVQDPETNKIYTFDEAMDVLKTEKPHGITDYKFGFADDKGNVKCDMGPVELLNATADKYFDPKSQEYDALINEWGRGVQYEVDRLNFNSHDHFIVDGVRPGEKTVNKLDKLKNAELEHNQTKENDNNLDL